MSAPTKLSTQIGVYSKAVVALLGSVILLLSQITPVLQFLPEGGQNAVSGLLAILVGVSTYLVKNTPTAQTLIDDARDLGLVVKDNV